MTTQRGYHNRLTVRSTQEEHEELEARAMASGLSLARYLVEAGIASTNPPDPQARALQERLLFQLHKVGVNLNQIARKLNAGDRVSDEQLTATLQSVARAVQAVEHGVCRCPVCSCGSQ